MNALPHNDAANDDDDLGWLAYRYVTDELTEGEREAFELRLADDQAAREAIASAVELLASLRAAGSPPVRHPKTSSIPVHVPARRGAERGQSAGRLSSRWRTVAARGGALAAAVIAASLALMTWGPWRPIADPAEGTDPSAGLAGLLGSVWEASPATDVEALPEESVVEPVAEESSINDASVIAADITAPDWLLAALAVEPEDEGDEEFEDG
jgi:anti-sigma factor RsiW